MEYLQVDSKYSNRFLTLNGNQDIKLYYHNKLTYNLGDGTKITNVTYKLLINHGGRVTIIKV